MSLFDYKRRKSRAVEIGGEMAVGGENRVRVQTMANTDTNDLTGSVEQALRCAEAGAVVVQTGESLIQGNMSGISRAFSVRCGSS